MSTATVTTGTRERRPVGGLGHQLRALFVVWRREMIRFRHDRARMFALLLQPLLFLFIMGPGLGRLVDTGEDVAFTTFLFPGVLAISVLFTASFAGVSLVWDREFGFLREMLVAPVSTFSIIAGKCLGGATVATLQSVILLALAGLVGVPYHPLLLVELLALLFVASFMLTTLGVLVSTRMRQVQAAMPTAQMIILPMMFLSGALFPVADLPQWLGVAVRLSPLTYVVQPMRSAVFDHLTVSEETRQSLAAGLTWFGWELPVGVQVLVAVGFTAALLGLAMALFDRSD